MLVQAMMETQEPLVVVPEIVETPGIVEILGLDKIDEILGFAEILENNSAIHVNCLVKLNQSLVAFLLVLVLFL